jgi:hypothetical protein
MTRTALLCVALATLCACEKKYGACERHYTGGALIVNGGPAATITLPASGWPRSLCPAGQVMVQTVDSGLACVVGRPMVGTPQPWGAKP